MKEIIKLENVVRMVEGNRRAVNGLSFCIRESEHVAVYGAPGSGKGTLMRLVAGMDMPSAGKIFVLDEALHKMDANAASDFRNRNIGVVCREHGFMERLAVYENVALPLAARGMPSPQRKRAVKDQLKALGIWHIAHAYPAQISAFDTMVASIARAVIAQPKILMLYEIAARLSEKEMEQITGIVSALSEYGDYTVLSFSVNINDGLHTERHIKLDHGKVREDIS